MTAQIKLHIGGTEVKEGWKIFNIIPGPGVDIVGDCRDLSLFGDGTVDEVYASHVMEHMPANEAMKATQEIYRVLKPGGVFKGSVPDMTVLCRLYTETTDPALQIKLTHVIYGGHMNDYDIHHFGFNFKIMTVVVAEAGFAHIEQVDFLNEFADTSMMKYEDTPISLNFIATK